MRTTIKLVITMAALLAAVVVPASAASAGAKKCAGLQAYRCAWVWDIGKLYGIGSLEDRTDGRDRVTVKVELQGQTSAGWRTLATNSRSATDKVSVATAPIVCTRGKYYRSKVTTWWNGKKDYLYSNKAKQC